MREIMLGWAVVLPLCLAISTVAHAAGCAAVADGSAHGFAVHHYYYDPVLKRTWAVIIDCRHPEWPAAMQAVVEPEPVPDGSAASSAIPDAQDQPDSLSAAAKGLHGLWLLAGDHVRLWKAGSVRIELSGIAVESAPLGAVVRVRTGAPAVLLHGTVRGLHSVELAADGPGWQQ